MNTNDQQLCPEKPTTSYLTYGKTAMLKHCQNSHAFFQFMVVLSQNPIKIGYTLLH